jgi:hypothetical protein
METVHTGSFYKGDAARGCLKGCNRPVDPLQGAIAQTFEHTPYQESLTLCIATWRGNMFYNTLFYRARNTFFLNHNHDRVAGLHEYPFELGHRMLRKATEESLLTCVEWLDCQRELTDVRNLTDIT